jgi:hypothetical protein
VYDETDWMMAVFKRCRRMRNCTIETRIHLTVRRLRVT